VKIIVRNGIMYFVARSQPSVEPQRIFEVASVLSADLEVYDTDRATPCDSPDPEIVRLLGAGS
jgi:hypothetical protein